MKEKAAIRCLKTFVIVIILFVVGIVLFSSCATEKSFAQKEKELCKPNGRYFKIIWCDQEFVYLEGHDPVRNVDKQLYFVGSYLIVYPYFDRL